MSTRQFRLRLLAVGAVAGTATIFLLIYLSVRANQIVQPDLRTSGKPDTAEVAIRVRNDFHSEHAVASTCNQPSAGRWTCSVTLADGRKASARAVWHTQPEKLSVSLTSAGFR